jgi:creatinine amidohydrolase
MKIKDMNWMQVEDYLKRDDRCVVPIGSTEQHAQLSLLVDGILAERVAADAAEPLGVPVFPPMNYGVTPYFRGYPGTVSLRVETLLHVAEDILECLASQGFKRILIVNGHGGNSPVGALAQQWVTNRPGIRVKFHNWWNAPKTLAKVKEIDPVASHASWMENFPWTRLAGVALPDTQKPMADNDKMRVRNPQAIREYLGDGNMGGLYQRSDAEMQALWDVAVVETRSLLEEGWD